MMSSAVMLGLIITTLVTFTGVDVRSFRGHAGSVEDPISARDSTGSWRTTVTLVASVMGVWVLLSAPGAGVSFGIAVVVGHAVGEAAPMLVYARLDPRTRELILEGHPLTEYAHVRYGTATYAFVLLVNAPYMFIFPVAELIGIAGAFPLVAGVPQWQIALLVGGFVLLYMSYGGLRASTAIDAVQVVVVIPLLLLAFAGVLVAFGGPATVIDGITATNPALLDLRVVAGLQLGLALAFATPGAELINQTWWQRICTADSSETAGRSSRTATLTNGAIVLVTAFFGVVAVGSAAVVTDPASAGYNTDAAFLALLGEAFPEWLVLAAVLLALLSMTSSTDTLFNVPSSFVTADLARLFAELSDRHLVLGLRALTVVVAAAAIYVSLRVQSALRLFSLADLLNTIVASPPVYGLYSTRITGLDALASSLIGLAVGLAFFPDLRGAITSTLIVGGLLLVADPLYLTSFSGAFMVSTVASLAAARLAGTGFDLGRLLREIRRFDSGQTGTLSSG